MPNEFIARNGIIALNNSTITGSLNVSGNITTPGTLTVQTIVAQTITSSTDFVTGSTKFGSTTANTHQFTGSILQSGSLAYFAGSVGIGTASPLVKLDLRGDEYVSGYLVGFDVNPLSNYAYRFTNDGGNSFINVVGGNLGIGTTTATSKLYIRDGSNTNLRLYGSSGVFVLSAENDAGSSQIPLNLNNTVRITSDGNVGIGTTSPGYKLDVVQTTNDTYIRAKTTTAGAYFIADSATDGYYGYSLYNGTTEKWFIGGYGSSDLSISLTKGGTQYMTILRGNGNVGIGTTSPSAKLHVYGGLTTLRAASSGQYDLIRLEDNAGSAYGAIGVNTSGWMYLSNTTSGTQHFVLTSGGNVGIGTTSPSRLLHVAGNIHADGNCFIKGNNNELYFASSSIANASIGTDNSHNIGRADTTGYHVLDSVAGDFVMGAVNGGLTFGTSNSLTYATARMRINNVGNVGIGTTSPARKLDVNGTSIFRDFTTVVATNGNAVSNITWLSTDSGIMNIYTGGSSTVQLNSNGVSYINGGSVGIGTTSPASTYVLDVRGGNILFNNANVNVVAKDTGTGYATYVAQSQNGSGGILDLAAQGSTANSLMNGAPANAGIIGMRGSHELHFGTGATSRMMINTSGCVGIGTTNPGYKLDVSGSSALFRISSTSATFQSPSINLLQGSIDTVITATNTGLELGTYSAHPILFKVSNTTEAIRIISNGNVGIGTTSPNTRLDVQSTTNSTWGNLSVFDLTSSGTGVGGVITFNGYKQSTTNGAIFAKIGGLKENSTVGDESGALVISTSTSVGTVAEKMRITSGGNVGIGTTSPSYKLDVIGNAKLGSGTSALALKITGDDNYIEFDNSGTYIKGGGNLTVAAISNLLFLTGASERMRITSGGIVSIGATDGLTTSTYAGKLAVYTLGGANLTIGGGSNTTNTVMSRFITVNTNNGNSGNESSTQFYGITSIESALTTATSNASSNSGGYIMFKTKGDAGTLDERMRIASDGYVGIGTTSPSVLTQMEGNDANVQVQLRLKNNNIANGNKYLALMVGGTSSFGISGWANSSIIESAAGTNSNLVIGNYEAGPIIFQTNNRNEKVRIASDGNVGIGTTSPGYLLHVRTAVAANFSLEQSSTNANYTTFVSNGVARAYIGVENSAGTGLFGSNDAYGMSIGTPTATGFNIATNNTIRLRINSSGNVGIGTTTPDRTLTINGDTSILGNNYISTSKFFQWEGGAYWTTRVVSSGNQFEIYRGDTGTSALVVSSGNNVGIGTTSPITKLDVNGSIQAGSGGTFGTGANGASIYMSTTSGVGLSGNLSGYSRNLIKTDGTSAIEIGDPSTSLISAVNIGAGDASGVIALKTGGNNTRLYINSSGNVGIGTTSPTTTLHVRTDTGVLIKGASSTTDAILSLIPASGGRQYDFRNYGSSFGIKDNSADVIRLFFHYDGNTGMGTTSPGSNLTIQQASTSATLGIRHTASGNGYGWRFATTGTTTNDLIFSNEFNGSFTERMRIDSGGNVGIGTTTITDKLEVRGADNGITISSISANRPVLQFVNGSTMMLKLSANGTYGAIADTTGDLMFFKGGNVGIGSTSPAVKLDVNGSILTNSTLYAGSISSTRFTVDGGTIYAYYAAETNARVAIGRDIYGGGQSGIALGGNGGFVIVGDASGTVGTAMAFSVGASIGGGSSAEKMRITSGGNVGIGTTSPDSKFHMGPSNGSQIRFNYAGSGDNYYDGVTHYFRNSGGASNVMTLLNGGSVGIGTTSPGTQLHIQGSVPEITFTATGLNRTSWIGMPDGANMYIKNTSAGNLYVGSANAVFLAYNGGNVGINNVTSPAYALDVSGTIRATGDVIAYSDARVKDNVETITDALTKVTSLRGVSYTRKDSEDKSRKVGVIAQEVLDILPEVVQQDDSGNYSVAYGNIVGVLIEAIKELKAEINELKNNK